MDRNLLGRATDGSDAPTPGYLYIDLAKAATANPSACQEMAQYLTRKLANKQNPNIKTKCCKVIAKLAEQVPRNQFRRCIAQDPSAVAAIKEAINFRGPIDPLQGDAKNEKVRNAAKEALEAVYTESPDAPAGTPMQGISASYASAPHAGGYGGAAASSAPGAEGGPKRMDGIGNPNYSDPRLDPRYNGTAPTNFVDAMKEAGDIVKGMIQDPLARNIGSPGAAAVPNRGHSGNLPGYGNNRGTYGGGGPPGAAELRAQTGGQWTMASNRGPGAVGGGATSSDYGRDTSSFNSGSQYNGGNSTSASAGRVGGSWGSAPATGGSFGTPSVTVNHAPASAGGATGGAAPSDGTYEKNMILELCPPGGLKPVPPPDKLANFARAVGGLNPDLVCPVLLDFLEEGQPWIIRAKALCVMETAVQNGIASDGSNPYKTFFHACAAEIQPLAAHPRAAIKDPARRVLLLVGVTPGPGADVPSSAAPRAAAPVAAPAPNLLEFDDGPTEPAPVAPSQPPPAPPSEAPPAPPANDMFGGMKVKGSSVAAPAPAAPAPPAPAPSGLLDFGSEAATPPPAPSTDPFAASPASAPADTSGAASMFGNLSVKDTAKPASAEVAEAAPTGSAFGFINSDANPPAATPAPAPAAPAPAPQPATFDPLQGSVGAANPMAAMAGMTMPVAGASPQMQQQKMMAMSPQQMQAMAYQQMMMQQQQQYMQMMAMRGSMPPAMPFPAGRGGPAPPGGSMKMSMGVAPAKKDDKKFDFVKDTMSANMKK